MKNSHYTSHIFSLCALFVLGNAIILMPFYESGSFLSVLICAALSLLLILLINLLIKWGEKNKSVLYVVATVISIAAIYGAATTFFDYLKFLKSIQMPQTSGILLSSALLGLIMFFTLNSTSAIFKYSLLVAIIGVIMIAICFIVGIRNFEFVGFKTNLLKFNFSIGVFLRLFSALAVVPLLVWLKFKNTSAKPLFLGTAAGFFVLCLCIVQSVFTLRVANDISYPYLKAVGVISSSSLFTRLDGLVYFVFFVTAVVKITVCVKMVYLTAKNLKRSV